jgi:hypothetical protein
MCPDCGVWVREVETTWGETLILNAARDPNGRVVPWISEHRPNGLPAARILPAGVPAEDDRTWSVHECTGIPGSNLLAEEPRYFGTRLMWSDARNEEFLYEECPGPYPGHKPLAVFLKYADQYEPNIGAIQPRVMADGGAVFIFTPDMAHPAGNRDLEQWLYNHDPDEVIRVLNEHGPRGTWIAELGLWQPQASGEEAQLLSFANTRVQPCSLPLV